MYFFAFMYLSPTLLSFDARCFLLLLLHDSYDDAIIIIILVSSLQDGSRHTKIGARTHAWRGRFAVY
jgi:hypothetical protein